MFPSTNDMKNQITKKSTILATSMTSMAEANILTSCRGMTLYASISNDSVLQKEKKLEHTEKCADEIILAKELFSNIINISSDELLKAGNYDDDLTIDTCFEDLITELINFLQMNEAAKINTILSFISNATPQSFLCFRQSSFQYAFKF